MPGLSRLSDGLPPFFIRGFRHRAGAAIRDEASGFARLRIEKPIHGLVVISIPDLIRRVSQ